MIDTQLLPLHPEFSRPTTRARESTAGFEQIPSKLTRISHLGTIALSRLGQKGAGDGIEVLVKRSDGSVDVIIKSRDAYIHTVPVLCEY